MPLDLYTWSVIIFIIILSVFIWKDRKNFQREGILLLRRTEIGLKFFDSQARKHPKFWRWYGNIAAIVSFPLIFGFVALLLFLLYRFITTRAPQEAVGLVLPIPISSAETIPGFIGVPFWYWIIAIIIISVIHEFTHGILARLENVGVKSSGFGFLGPLMMAFVETDDKKMSERGWKATARIAAAGPFTNILMAMIIYLAMFGLAHTGNGEIVDNVFRPQDIGIIFTNTTPGLPAHTAGLQNGSIIAIDGKKIHSVGEFFHLFPNETGKSATFTVQSLDKKSVQNYTLSPVADPDSNRTLIGIGGLATPKFNPTFLFWLFALNLGLGLANLMPIGPIDGGRIWGEFAKAKIPHGEKIAKYLSRFTIFTLLFLIITALAKNFF